MKVYERHGRAWAHSCSEFGVISPTVRHVVSGSKDAQDMDR